MKDKKINIFGIEYDIKFVDDNIDMQGLLGRIYHDFQLIKIKKDCPLDVLNCTIFHEITHAILKKSGLEDLLYKKESVDVESFTEILSNALFNVWKSNPNFLEDLKTNV
jgi:Zn-dependent peptidase ImmA (M78 family)